MSEAAPDGFQGHPSVDQLGGVDVAQLMNRGRDLGFLAVLGPELLDGGIPQRSAPSFRPSTTPSLGPDGPTRSWPGSTKAPPQRSCAN